MSYPKILRCTRRGASAWLLLAFAGTAPDLAAASVRFDGNRDVIAAAEAQYFPAGDLQRLLIEAVAENSDGSSHTLAMLVGGKTLFALRFDAASRRIELHSAARSEPRPIGPQLTKGRPFVLDMVPTATGWQISIDGTVAASVERDELDPTLPAPLTLVLGEEGLVGTFDRVSVGLRGGQGLHLADDGSLQPGENAAGAAFSPRLGVYVEADSELNIPSRVSLSGVGRHGIYKRQAFYALVRHQDRLGLVFDWGGMLELVPDPASPRRFVPADPDLAWAGGIEFNAGADAAFVARGVSDYRPAEHLLHNDATYVLVEGAADGRDLNPTGQKLGEVWAANDKPSGFKRSVDACYDLNRMDPIDLQTTGCSNGIFEEPPPSTANWRPTSDNKILPYGWRYDGVHVSRGGFYSSISTSAAELEDSHSAASGFSVSAGLSSPTDAKSGVKEPRYSFKGTYSQNTVMSERRKNMRRTKRMESVHQNMVTSHAIVLDPIEARLNKCFIQSVLRVVPDAHPPAYFVNDADPVTGLVSGGDRCPESYKGPNAIPLDAAGLVDRYGTHYAYAITYGAWGQQQVSYSASAIGRLVEDSSKVDESLGFEGKSPLIQGGATFTSQKTSGSMADLQYEGELETGGYVCIGGTSCADGKVDAGSALAPVYLHLRPLDTLLSPPFFTDPRITVELRRRVREEIAKRTAQRPVDNQPVFQVYRVTIEGPLCIGDASFQASVCPDFGAGSPLADIDLIAVAVLKDGRTFPLTSLKLPLTALHGNKMTLLFHAGQGDVPGPIESIAFSIARHGEPLDNDACCKEPWSLLGQTTVSAERNLTWADKAKLEPSRSKVAYAVAQTPTRPAIAFGATGLAAQFSSVLLDFENEWGQIGVFGRIEAVDVAQSLGFIDGDTRIAVYFEQPNPRAASIFKPGVSPFDYLVCPGGSKQTAAGCLYPAPQETCPAPLTRYGRMCANDRITREIAFHNKGVYDAIARVTYALDGKPQQVKSGKLRAGGRHVFSLPAGADLVTMKAWYYDLSTSLRMVEKPIFANTIDTRDGPACYSTTGTILKTGWNLGRDVDCPEISPR